MAYMWRDIGRRARTYGFDPPLLPAPYPLKEFDLANKIAVVAETEGWCADYVCAAYRHWFEQGHEPGSEPGVTDALRELGRDPARVVASARTGRIDERYKRDTEEAKALGVFGSPTFVVDGEVFWGDDRLEDAIDWDRAKAAANPVPQDPVG